MAREIPPHAQERVGRAIHGIGRSCTMHMHINEAGDYGLPFGLDEQVTGLTRYRLIQNVGDAYSINDQRVMHQGLIGSQDRAACNDRSRG